MSVFCTCKFQACDGELVEFSGAGDSAATAKPAFQARLTAAIPNAQWAFRAGSWLMIIGRI
jgi:hypothetical protein